MRNSHLGQAPELVQSKGREDGERRRLCLEKCFAFSESEERESCRKQRSK